jgi:hypothetical protein
MRQEIDRLKGGMKTIEGTDDIKDSDEKIKNIKKEKAEKEYVDLLNEVNTLRKEVWNIISP